MTDSGAGDDQWSDSSEAVVPAAFEPPPAPPAPVVADQSLGLAPPPPAVPPVPSPQPAPAVPQPMRRAPVNYQPNEAGWWLATDGLWYPPETATGAAAQTSAPLVSETGAGAQTVVVQVGNQAPGVGAGFVTAPPKSHIAAGLLGIFLGVFGVHRFYLGYSGIGVTMLLITVLSLGLFSPFVALWGLIEGIVLLAGGMNHDKWGRALT